MIGRELPEKSTPYSGWGASLSSIWHTVLSSPRLAGQWARGRSVLADLTPFFWPQPSYLCGCYDDYRPREYLVSPLAPLAPVKLACFFQRP